MAKLDNQTSELPGLPPLPKKRGRPATGKAKTAAQRMREFRDRTQRLKDNLTRTVESAIDIQNPLHGLTNTALLELVYAELQRKIAAEEKHGQPLSSCREAMGWWLEIGFRLATLDPFADYLLRTKSKPSKAI